MEKESNLNFKKMKVIVLCVLLLLVLNYVCGQITRDPCTVTFTKSGNSYNISGAYNPKQDYTFKAFGNQYYISPCHNTHFVCTAPTPVCQSDVNNAYYSLGDLASSLNNPIDWSELMPIGTGFTVRYQYGSNGRQSMVTYVCDTNENVVISNITENPALTYNIVIQTGYACPINETTGALCCLYKNSENGTEYRTTCTSDGTCPGVPGWTNNSSWHVTSCNDCHFNKIKNQKKMNKNVHKIK